jgi:DNA-nicking Smr family endonuclease|tara:strand:- start:582 stop:782 length:201 start_codon:yes stop_codon:yes gene_type:complete
MKELDLHGVKHEEVERLLENFILLNNPPLKVITGNSEYMRSAVEKFCRKHNMICERWANWGEYTIR